VKKKSKKRRQINKRFIWLYDYNTFIACGDDTSQLFGVASTNFIVGGR